jgi:hypothetical protein
MVNCGSIAAKENLLDRLLEKVKQRYHNIPVTGQCRSIDNPSLPRQSQDIVHAMPNISRLERRAL